MHSTLPGSGLLFLPLVVGASALLVAAGAANPRSHRETRRADPQVEMEVLGVADLDEESSMVVLRQKGGGSVLPIFIGRNEGHAIDLRLRHARHPRPLTHDLLSKAIEALGAKVVRIEIAAVKDEVFRAVIHLEQGGRALQLDARPSDSIALALGTEAPILVARRVLDEAGLSQDELDQLRRRGGHGHDEGTGSGRDEPEDTLTL